MSIFVLPFEAKTLSSKLSSVLKKSISRTFFCLCFFFVSIDLSSVVFLSVVSPIVVRVSSNRSDSLFTKFAFLKFRTFQCSLPLQFLFRFSSKYAIKSFSNILPVVLLTLSSSCSSCDVLS
uniref:F-120 protein n=1 Tax=Saccharomyces cerevisiae TaxID=4932 RepID=E9PA50_YEASX|nr:F-120 protein [Saccharomyces cerevisiae]